MGGGWKTVGGTASLKPLSPVPLFETRVGGLDFLHNTTFATKALFTSDFSRPPWGQFQCPHLREVKVFAPIARG